MANPQVSEDKRFCAKCGAPVGPQPRRPAQDARRASAPSAAPSSPSRPKLKAGDLVGGQYEVVGALAHGGLGWIYLAADKNVSDRWVVLKGLLNTGDLDAYQAAVAERQFLAEVQHPLIVNIYNFAMHENAGYTVMEYVGGQLAQAAAQGPDGGQQRALRPVPRRPGHRVHDRDPARVRYLHSQGLLYCDFKPDNIIQAGDAVKLIDLGGVRRIERQRERDLRDGRLPGPRDRDARPERGQRHLHDRAHPGRAAVRVPRPPVHLRQEPAGRR